MIALFLGVLIGLTLALTGAGGGILAVPALTIGLGWSMTQASPIALLTVASAAAIGMVSGLKEGLVRFRAALLISFAGIIAAPFGQRLAHILPERGLIGLFACVMLIVAIRLFLNAHPAASDIIQTNKTCLINEKTGRINWNGIVFLKLCFIGLLSGLMTGLLGVGGGFIIVPALMRCSNISMNAIVATSLMVIALISSSAVIAAYTTVTWSEPAFLFIGGAVIGMLIGRQFSGKIPAAYMQRGFAVLVTGVAFALFYRLFF
ncbi:MAG: sulfite exporter TauE/SafE family protein [Gallionella sp.]